MKLNLWQVIGETLLYEPIVDALRSMDDPEAEVSDCDLDERLHYVDGVRAIADWLVPEEPTTPNSKGTAHGYRQQERQRIRQILLDEAAAVEKSLPNQFLNY